MTEETKEILTQLGAIIKQKRIEKQLTLLDLEVITGIAQGELSKIENAQKNYTVTTLVKIAKGLDITLSKLLNEFEN